MIIQIQDTAFIFLVLSFLVIYCTESKDLKNWFMVVVLSVFSISATLAVSIALWRIWA